MKNSCRCLVLAAVALAPVAAAQKAGDGKQMGRAMSKGQPKEIALIRAVLDSQVAAWNRGDVEAFMDGYALSPETTFVSGDAVIRGWQTVLERYRKNYDSRAKMGTLAFSELEIRVLERDIAMAVGRWQLTRADDSPHGRFTLLLRRTEAGWRIFHATLHPPRHEKEKLSETNLDRKKSRLTRQAVVIYYFANTEKEVILNI
ncbi:MAG: nuclear transport factor 2 family protein [Pyrinomonadaceae bacterium]